MPQEYDIIGDVHGRARALEDLLARLGYVQGPQGHAHPEGRKVVFLGDFIDRGPEQKRALEIVRAMVASGNAVAIMGNHEFNAICYATQAPGGGYVRTHDADHDHQHARFLAEFPFGSPEHREVIAWFKTLPVYRDFGNFRAVHACWDDESKDAIRPWLDRDNCLTGDAYTLYADENSTPYKTVQNLLMGPEQPMPDGVSYADPQGKIRTVARHLWWRPASLSVRERLHIPCPLSKQESEALESGARLRDVFMRAAMPTFVGHYGLPTADGEELSDTVAVLDYKGGVTAYRHESSDTAVFRERFLFSPQ